MKQCPVLLSLLIVLYSCDNSYNAYVRNATNENIEVTFAYDKKRLDSVYKNTNYILAIPQLENNPASYIKHYDTAIQSITFTVPPHEILQVEHGLGGYNTERADFSLFKNIMIKTGEKENYYPRVLLDTVFKKVKRNHFELVVN